ncbi:MAG: capsule assembly Wzi family protein [Gemmatimonadetes bacterium]|nr:capsule assembly Wzi family protein [Gemmatimonadota bacterium]
MRSSRSRGFLAAALLALTPVAQAAAQSLAIGDPFEDYLRVLQILGEADLGSFTVRPIPSARVSILASNRSWAARELRTTLGAADAPRVTLLDPRFRTYFNSSYPVGQNDGAVSQGKGLTSALDFGARASWRGLSLMLHPALVHNQNASFELGVGTVTGLPVYAYPWRVIDLPQRFGPDAFWTLDPGQSELRLDVRGATLGVSTANQWWGPATRNPIIMSNNAAGFPHAFLGTDGQLDTRIGGFEARWIWGRLTQSDWFDPNVANTRRFVTGLVGTYSPDFVEGLSLGLTRLFYGYIPDDGLPFSDYFAVLGGLRKKTLGSTSNPTGDDEHDQLLSLFARWVLPESGFEVYGEWARNDHAWSFRDFILEPEHSQAYTLGLRKAYELTGDRLLALTGELTHLERSTTYEIRANPTYYAHHIVTQGYTQEGQVIGAGIGPGGGAQFLAADLYAPWGRAGVYVERQMKDNDAYYAWAIANNQIYCCHNVSLNFGASTLYFVGDFDLGAGFIITHEYHRYFYGRDLTNLNLSLYARWRRR